MKKTLKTLLLSSAIATTIATTIPYDFEVKVRPINIEAASIKFSDFKSSHWAYQTILQMVEQKVVGGYPNGTFKPDKQVTEAEFLKMLVFAFVDDKDIPQVQSGGHWAENVYLYAEQKHYRVSNDIKGRDKVINRAKVAELVSATQGVNYVGNDAIRYLLGEGLSNGRSSKTISGYEGQASLTRAEAVAFIANLKDKGVKELKEMPAQPSDKSSLKDILYKPNTTKPVANPTTNPMLVLDRVKDDLEKLGFSEYKEARTENAFDFTTKDGDYIHFTGLGDAYQVMNTKNSDQILKGILAILKETGIQDDNGIIAKTFKNAKIGVTNIELKNQGYEISFYKDQISNGVNLLVRPLDY